MGFIGPAGVPELSIITLVVVVVLVPAFRIARKLGYPSPLAVVVFIPFANLIILWLLAFIEWPIEREVRRLKEHTATD
jgi:hypothetical protein